MLLRVTGCLHQVSRLQRLKIARVVSSLLANLLQHAVNTCVAARYTQLCCENMGGIVQRARLGLRGSSVRVGRQHKL